ncbi:winged helix-turn-helix domain-containing protein [Arthrobacter sp. UYCu712]|uniref:winged helix-turn-helix domain-containing protein n=1 Tax=Arthrobacter sp. UYCu712 TaxID=3156340 RepID=UPI00339AFD7F
MTNKQLAVRLAVEPGTTLYHVRQLVNTGFLAQGDVRTGESGALEKPYRSTNMSWWLDNPLADTDVETRNSPVGAFQAELEEAGPGSITNVARFVLHLSPEQIEELEGKILAVLDDYIDSDAGRLDQPAHGGMFILHQLAQQHAHQPATGSP